MTNTEGARHWIHEDLELAIKIPDESLAGDLERLLKLDIGKYKVFIIAQCLRSLEINFRYEQALKIYVIHKEEVDEDYFKKQATDNQVLTGLASLHSDYQDFINRP